MGVPQGSILGPFLLVYINDLPSLVKDAHEIVLFADDTSLLFKVKRQQPTYDDVNNAISKVEKWFTANNLLLNEMKTKCIRFSLPNVRHGSGTISVRNKELEFVNSTVFLGITLDDRLQWGPHITGDQEELSVGTPTSSSTPSRPSLGVMVKWWVAPSGPEKLDDGEPRWYGRTTTITHLPPTIDGSYSARESLMEDFPEGLRWEKFAIPKSSL
ncbi:RNA-directed DNA polymerase from mobile element jockey [Eumeta japonica]|uniref:RNA-directed DNA polymerase from mobile element jockey n=1 Tax=Eumeta variegata TaxID=151549 RepID=A0A4C1WAD5_EUMVA|nr:RNA-directed DNA polymerase from mobile element jockey [Eumeta japonica]